MNVTKETQYLGHVVKRARQHQQLTQLQVAALSGVGVRFIRALEQGKASCHIDKVLTVCQFSWGLKSPPPSLKSNQNNETYIIGLFWTA